MTRLRWDQLPAAARAALNEQGVSRAKRSRRVLASTCAYRCGGVTGCGAILRDGYPAAQRHADSHGGHRLEMVLTP